MTSRHTHLCRVVLSACLAGIAAAGCAGTGINSVLMMPDEPTPKIVAPADSVAITPRTAVPSGPPDSTNALGQVLLMLPFANSSDYDGPWPVHTAMPQTLTDSLVSNRFLRIVPVDSVMAFLTPAEQRGEIDPERAADLARFLNADWAVLGDIDELTMKKFQATVPLGGYRSYEAIV